jgi:hypothetical protein
MNKRIILTGDNAGLRRRYQGKMTKSNSKDLGDPAMFPYDVRDGSSFASSVRYSSAVAFPLPLVIA